MTKVLNENLPKWSDAERRILGTIVNNQSTPQLTFRPQNLHKKGFQKEVVFVAEIPQTLTQEILEQYYPFHPIPNIDDYKHCLHENKNFKVEDYMLIYLPDCGFQIVSPYFFESGGMCIDWTDCRED